MGGVVWLNWEYVVNWVLVGGLGFLMFSVGFLILSVALGFINPWGG